MPGRFFSQMAPPPPKKKKKIFYYFLGIFFLFLMGPYGGKNVKMLLLQIAAKKVFKLFLNFSSLCSSQNYVWDF